MNKMIYESSADEEETANATTTTYDYCNDTIGNTTSFRASWWTVDLAAFYHISFVEINPLPGSLCPENSLCGRLKNCTFQFSTRSPIFVTIFLCCSGEHIFNIIVILLVHN